MAQLGLRRIDINFLQVLFDPINKEHYWHCTYIKKSGNGATQPRRIEPLTLIDRDGNEVKWNPMERLKVIYYLYQRGSQELLLVLI